MLIFKAKIARNSELLRKFTKLPHPCFRTSPTSLQVTQKLDILGARYEFMNRFEAP